MSIIAPTRPFGLTHQIELGPEHRCELLERAVYDVDQQLTLIDGKPLADHPQMLDSTVTWNTTDNDNKSDADK